ncbi:hypothetical protein AB0C07_07740 [Actinoplanes missouriensis]|uniref:hypothetical protein n=1 Tax=Actinoplanes missouriensis TaxID=1866 RepID=UPI0033CB876D
MSAVRRRPAIVAAGVVLGLLAFAADAVDGPTGHVMIALVSSGLAWGSAAVLAGRAAPDRRSAMTGATVLLASATLVYYLLILVVSRRWSGGSPEGWYGLRSVAIMTAAWLSVSVVAGPSLGLLGHLTRTARLPLAALPAGAACGALSGQGWLKATAAPPWLIFTYDGPDAPMVRAFQAAKLIEVLLPLALLAWLATAHCLWRAWPLLLTATSLTAAASALAWHLLYTTANHLA